MTIVYAKSIAAKAAPKTDTTGTTTLLVAPELLDPPVAVGLVEPEVLEVGVAVELKTESVAAAAYS